MNKENTFYICYGDFDGISLYEVSGKLVPKRTDMFMHVDHEGFIRVTDLNTGYLIATHPLAEIAVRNAIMRIDRDPQHTASARMRAENRITTAGLGFPVNLLPIKNYKKSSL